MRGIRQLAHDFIFGSPAPVEQPPAERYDDLSTLNKLNILISSPDVPPSQKVRLSAIAMQGWNFSGGLVNQWTGEKFYNAMGYPAIVHDNPTLLRRRSRIAWKESVQARELLQSLVDNVIGSGLKLESAPKWELIQPGLEIASEALDAQRRRWTRETQIRFDLYMSSKDPDITGRKNGYQLQRLFFLNYLRDGEVFVLFRYSPDPRRLSPLTVQFIGPDQILNPKDTAMYEAAEARGNRIVEGIELDDDNNEVAFFIFDEKAGTSTRVSKYGPKSRRIFMAHALIQENIGQVRGTPILSSIVHELQKITDMDVAELEAAVINAMYATWVKPGPEKRGTDITRGLQIPTTSAFSASAPDPRGADPRIEPPQTGLAIQPGMHVGRLGPSEEIVSFDTKRPNTNQGVFKDHIMKAVAASTRQPLEVVEMKFTSSYSAAKAAFSLAWASVETWVKSVAADLMDPWYEQWFTEDVRRKEIKIEGLGGAWDSSPVLRRAWLYAGWIGVPMPTMEPLKEAQADDMRIKSGLLTRERAAREFNGSDYYENTRRLKVENDELAEANASLAPAVEPKAEKGDDVKPGDTPADGGQGEQDEEEFDSGGKGSDGTGAA
jgi:lambda family phage portal protein